MTALSLSAVGSLGRELGVTLSANHFLALVLSGEGSQGSLNLERTHTTTSKTENKMQGGLLLNVIVGKSTAILELLTSEDESLLVWGNTFLVLDLGPIIAKNNESLLQRISIRRRSGHLLDVLDGVRRFNIKSDCLSREGLDKNLHTMNEFIFI